MVFIIKTQRKFKNIINYIEMNKQYFDDRYINSNNRQQRLYQKFNQNKQVYNSKMKAESLSNKQLLKQHYYLKLFLYHLQGTSNLPTLSNPELLVNIQRQNERLEQEIELLRQGKREQMLRKRLQQLNVEAQQFMNKMKQFKIERENEKNILKELSMKK